MLLYVDSHYASPYAMSVFVALQEKEAQFQIEEIVLEAGEHAEEPYASFSLTQRIPALLHGGLSLSESSAITEYLDEALPGARLYPTELRARARARQVQAWLRSDLMHIRQERPTEVIFYGTKYAPLSEAATAAAAKLFTIASALIEHGEENLFGAWSIADTDLAIMLNRLVSHGDPVPEHLAEYVRRQWGRESVQAWVRWPVIRRG